MKAARPRYRFSSVNTCQGRKKLSRLPSSSMDRMDELMAPMYSSERRLDSIAEREKAPKMVAVPRKAVRMMEGSTYAA